MDWRSIQQGLVDAGVQLVLPAATLPDGAKVTISLEGVEATGTITARSLHWSTMRGVNSIPVELDGTGQRVTVHASLVKETA